MATSRPGGARSALMVDDINDPFCRWRLSGSVRARAPPPALGGGRTDRWGVLQRALVLGVSRLRCLCRGRVGIDVAEWLKH